MGRRLALDQVEPTHLLLACALIYALIGEPADGLILLAFVGLIALIPFVGLVLLSWYLMKLLT
jgi:hypothetical protein